MRLIDADDFFARMENDTDLCAEMETDGLKALKRYLDMQPTSYDIDKVVEELETNKQNALEFEESIKEYNVWNKAIEIVKHGVVSDDVCEWKLEDDNLMTGCGDYFNLYDNCTGKFKYCPRCGKKIKIVGD